MLLALLLVAAPSDAKDLNGRIGVGVQQEVGNVPLVSVQYTLPDKNPLTNIQVGAEGGYLQGPSAPDGALFVGATGRATLVAEDNMNLYAGGGVGYGQQDGDSLVRIKARTGAEFFLFGLENLGFSAEVGLTLDVPSPTSATAAAWAGPYGLRVEQGITPAVAARYYF